MTSSGYVFDKVEYDKRMEWYVNARFGMFIHWGLYAIPARGEWVRSHENITKEAYMTYFEEFNPKDYNPSKWAKAAKDAGMQYVVLTSKHHDGFCLFDSKLTDFKSTNTKCGRDLIAEYVEAVRKEGLKVGLYFSLIDWYHEDYPHCNDRHHPMRGNTAYPDDNRNWGRYLEFLHGQIREICTNYGQIDILWFDFSYDDMIGEKWEATKLVKMVRELQPNVIIDNRLEASGEGFGSLYLGKPTPYHGDFVSPEQIIPPYGICDVTGYPINWEACITMNRNWGYCANDTLFKPSSMLIRKLVECVSKGGNMILNVGPDANGRFPDESTRILREIGEWMSKNNESIYGCGTALQANDSKNADKGMALIEKPENGRITGKKNVDNKILFYHLFENTIGPMPLPGIKLEQVKRIRNLATGCEIPISTSWVHSDYPGIVFADLGPDPILFDVVDTVLKVELK